MNEAHKADMAKLIECVDDLSKAQDTMHLQQAGLATAQQALNEQQQDLFESMKVL